MGPLLRALVSPQTPPLPLAPFVPLSPSLGQFFLLSRSVGSPVITHFSLRSY